MTSAIVPPSDGHEWMPIVGYSDVLSVAPGERIRFMVSTTAEAWEASFVRLIHGDEDPAGPGFKAEPRELPGGRFPGRRQTLPLGSYARVPSLPDLPERFALSAYVWPTAPGGRVQAILGRPGCALVLDEDGAPALWAGEQRLSTGEPLAPRRWYRVEARVDGSDVTVSQQPVDPLAVGGATVDGRVEIAAAGPFLIGALGEPAAHHFNGKIDSPQADPLARWDFSRDIGSTRVSDTGHGGHHGELVNMPLRAVTGRRWNGEETDWRRDPERYGAIHFHDDDLEDARWEPQLELTVPEGLRSGVYAAHLTAADGEDYVPFVVRPPRDRATARVALLLPTVSYVIYANEHLSYQNPRTPPAFPRILDRLADQDRYVAAAGLLSCYDHHRDGTGVVYASWLRPLVTMRPKYDLALIDAPHQLGADLHLVDWLEQRGEPYDVITDHDLHAEGTALLARYRVVLTGSHPEYWTTPMMDGLDGYLSDGGRLMYLGGNGFCWVTAIHPERPHVAELRRGDTGGAIWTSEPGEEHHSTTGERGGEWPRRGRGRRSAGVWFTGQGFDRSHPYRRLPDSRDPRAAWIFDGVEEDPIGAYGLVMGGAGGFEIDRFDRAAGSPPHALWLASADRGFSASYGGSGADWLQAPYQRALQERHGPPAPGEAVQYARGEGAPDNPLVRADMTYHETPRGGAVFSVGSIAWCGALSHNDYDNAVSRITGNVLRRFAA